MERIDLFECDDLSVAVSAQEPPLPTATEPLPPFVYERFHDGIDAGALLESTVPHAAVPQLLWPVVQQFVLGSSVVLKHAADAAQCVRELRVDLSDSESNCRLLQFSKDIPLKAVDADGSFHAQHCRILVASACSKTLTSLTLSSHVTAQSLQPLVSIQTLTRLKIEASCEAAALPFIGALQQLEDLSVRQFCSARGFERRPRKIDLDVVGNLSRLKFFRLGNPVSTLTPLKRCVQLERLHLDEVTYPTADFANIAPFLPRLKELIMMSMSGPSFAGLSEFRGLETLALHSVTPIDCDAIEQCALKEIHLLMGYHRDEGALRRLSTITTLTSLTIRNETLTADMLEASAKATSLTELDLACCTIDVASLRGFTNLRKLIIYSPDLTETEVSIVASLLHLQHLKLWAFKTITASMLRPLRACRQLSNLSIRVSSMCDTADALAAFRSFPALEVLRFQTPDEVYLAVLLSKTFSRVSPEFCGFVVRS